MFLSLMLVALAVGYKVFVEASKEKNDGHRTLGRLIGIYVMIIAFALSMGSLLKYSCLGKAGGPMGAKNAMCGLKK